MKAQAISNSFFNFFKEKSRSLLFENGKNIAQFIFTAFFIGIGIWFIKHERAELGDITTVITNASWQWVLIGVALTVVYILLQGLMYVASFAAVQSGISIPDAIVLFLKRNFVSVFLPAGGISSLAFFTGSIEKKGVKETQIHFASSIYGFIGILSVVLVAIPAFMYSFVEGTIGSGEWYALATVVLLSIALLFIYRSILKKGVVYHWMEKLFPSTVFFMGDLLNNTINRNKFLLAVVYSVLIEFVGIAHLYVSMIALHFTPSLFAAVMGYIISVIFLIVSPFLRGLGAIEVSMSYVLIQFGFGNVEAIAITFLYRTFEFWMPLFAGVLTFLSTINKLLMRIVPAFLLLSLGIINIISVLTPAIAERLDRLQNFIPVDAINVSNYFVMTAGLFMLITAAFMLKGLRAAWWFALILSIVSVFGHLTKAIDYEEATVALFVVIALLLTQKEYYIKSNPRLRNIGLQTALLSIVAILIYGTVGFYFLDKKHFNIDFSWIQSAKYTLNNYFLIGSTDLIPVDDFAKHFLYSINISGFISIGFLLYTFIRPYAINNNLTDEELETASELLKQFGNSALDYFKTYSDKMLFISISKKAFIAYRVSGNFAVALEIPVAETIAEMKLCIQEFDNYCYESGLKSVYYRVPEESLRMFISLRKKSLFIGQEGVVDLTNFSLEGGSKKSLRNGLKKVSEKGFKATIHLAPIKDGLLQKIKSVSDEWLKDTERSEIVFSQGMFVWEELKQQTIITVENAEEKVVAFLNIIPDYVKGEGTFDLLRKTKDAPNGIMDFILIELFNHFKSEKYFAVNIGFAPMSGLDDAHTFPEKSMKFAYEKIKSFSHYKGMRDFKDKFSPTWHNKYLIYTHDYDLLQVPAVLTKIIKP